MSSTVGGERDIKRVDAILEIQYSATMLYPNNSVTIEWLAVAME